MQPEDRRSAYRRKAEEIIDKDSLEGGRDETELVYELKVHQIELEMQNAELQSSQQELQRARRQYEMLFEYAPIGYFVFNRQGGIEEANEAATALLRAEHKYLQNKPFIVFLPREYHAPFFEHLRRAFNGGAIQKQELQLLDRDGGSRLVLLESRHQVNAQGVDQCLTAVTDLTETERIKNDLESARNEAVQAYESERFSPRAMLHEARYPLEGIEELASRLRSNQQPEAAGAIQQTARALLDLLRQLGELPADRPQGETGGQPFRAEELLHSVAALFEANVLLRGTTLEVTAPISATRDYVGDRRGLSQVLAALISNAAASTEGGTITLSAKETPLSEQLTEVTFSVRDTGVGIEPERHREIFRGSKDEETTPVRGLAIARQLVRRMGGQLYFESTPGKGTTFFCSVPLRTQERSSTEGQIEGEQPEPPEEQEADDRPYNILVAEDNAINVLVLRTLLERAGYRVVCVENGQEAVEKLAGFPFDLVLMDISMPVLDGIKATEKIRAGEAGVLDPEVPVIAITAHSMSGDREKFLAAGMTDYMAKPFAKEAVLAKVGEYRERRRRP